MQWRVKCVESKFSVKFVSFARKCVGLRWLRTAILKSCIVNLFPLSTCSASFTISSKKVRKVRIEGFSPGIVSWISVTWCSHVSSPFPGHSLNDNEAKCCKITRTFSSLRLKCLLCSICSGCPLICMILQPGKLQTLQFRWLCATLRCRVQVRKKLRKWRSCADTLIYFKRSLLVH